MVSFQSSVMFWGVGVRFYNVAVGLELVQSIIFIVYRCTAIWIQLSFDSQITFFMLTKSRPALPLP